MGKCQPCQERSRSPRALETCRWQIVRVITTLNTGAEQVSPINLLHAGEEEDGGMEGVSRGEKQQRVA